jgi:hypothetical protein
MDDGTEYAIKMMAELTGGGDSIAELTQLAEKLTAVETASTSFDQAIAQVKTALASAKSESIATADALAESTTKYAQLEKAAVRAWTAVEKASLKGAVPEELTKNLNSAVAAMRSEASALDQLKAKAAAASAAHVQLGDTLKKLEAGAKVEARNMAAAAEAIGKAMGAISKPAKEVVPAVEKLKRANVGETFEKLGGVLGRLGGPLGDLGAQASGGAGSIAKLATELGGAAAAGIAFVAVIALVVAGVTAAVVATAQWAVGLADANRAAHLTVEAVEQTSSALAGLSDILPDVTRATGLTGEELTDLAKQLAAAKVSAGNMPAALRAVATAEAALGKGGAAKFIEDLKTGKKTVNELAGEVDRKFGGIVARKLIGLDAQALTLKRNLSDTFGGLKIEGFLENLSKLGELLDQNTASGQAIKLLFEGIFQPLVDGAAGALPAIEAFVLGFEITALKIYIVLQPAIRAVKELFGGSTDSALPDALEVALFLGKTLSGVLLGIVSVLTVLGVVAGGLVATVAAPFIAIALAVHGVIAAVQGVVTYLQSTNLSSIGANLVGGLATGIAAGGPRVLAAIGDVVGGAITAAKAKLGIASDSKVFKAIGDFTVGGFQHQVERKTPAVQSALETMVEAPSSAARGGGASATVQSGGNTFHITVQSADGRPETMVASLRQMLIEILEGNVIESGGPEPAGAT